MNKKFISAKYQECCDEKSKNDDLMINFLNLYFDLCYLLSNNMINKQQFDLLAFLEQLSDNFNIYCNIKILFIVLGCDIKKILHFKHYVVYIGRLIKGFDVANKSNKSLFALEQLKIEYKIYVIREKLMYFINEHFPKYCEQAQSRLYCSFDDEVESTILKTFVYSVEIEQIEQMQNEHE